MVSKCTEQPMGQLVARASFHVQVLRSFWVSWNVALAFLSCAGLRQVPHTPSITWYCLISAELSSHYFHVLNKVFTSWSGAVWGAASGQRHREGQVGRKVYLVYRESVVIPDGWYPLTFRRGNGYLGACSQLWRTEVAEQSSPWPRCQDVNSQLMKWLLHVPYLYNFNNNNQFYTILYSYLLDSSHSKSPTLVNWAIAKLFSAKSRWSLESSRRLRLGASLEGSMDLGKAMFLVTTVYGSKRVMNSPTCLMFKYIIFNDIIWKLRFNTCKNDKFGGSIGRPLLSPLNLNPYLFVFAFATL